MHDRCPILIGQQSTYCESASCPCRHQYWCQVGMWMKDAGRNDILLTFYWVLVKGLRQALRWDNRKDDVSSYLTPKLLGSDWINRPQWIKKKKKGLLRRQVENVLLSLPDAPRWLAGWFGSRFPDLTTEAIDRWHHRAAPMLAYLQQSEPFWANCPLMRIWVALGGLYHGQAALSVCGPETTFLTRNNNHWGSG